MIKKNIYSVLYIFFFSLISGVISIHAQQPAFPGAEGYGKYTVGGRAGTVYEVTNLNDSGPGSLRDAVSQSNRTIVFRVSGNIELKSELRIAVSNLTIAGQTAPGDGICVRDYPTNIREADNIIIRYMRFRLGDRYNLTSSDALDIDHSHHVILDHCTMTWGIDECFSSYNGVEYISVQWCIVAEGLKLTNHSMGGLWGGFTTYHHNLLYANNNRNPKYNADSDTTDSRNNVIYNWGGNSAYTGSQGRLNLVDNYYKAGPSSSNRHRIVQGSDTFKMHVNGNYVAGYPEITADNWNGGVDANPIRYDVPFHVPYPVPEQSALEAYVEVAQHVGASFPRRDDADQRAIKNLLDSTGTIITRQSEVGGFPKLFSMPAPADSDHDGMPDDYETGLGLNPNDPEDRNLDKSGNGYTNLEDYLNGLPRVPTEYPKPGFLSAAAKAERKIYLRWYDHNIGESGFIIERSGDSSIFSVLDTVAAETEEYLDAGVEPSTSYYYRMKSFTESEESRYSYSDEVATFADGSKPDQAVGISPANNQGEVSITGATLRWSGGDYVLTFDVYLGTSAETLVLADSAINGTSYKTGGLIFGTDYFWRIDSRNDNGVTEGETWKFTTVENAVPELVLYWPFLEEDGLIVYDSTDFNNDGTAQNISVLNRGEGPFDRAISLANSGPTGHIELPDNPTISFDVNPFSIAFWMRLDAITDSSTYILHKGAFSAIEGTERNGKWFGLEMRDGNFRFSVDDNNNKSVATSSTSSFVTGEWVHVVLIRDVFKGTLYIYRNGFVSTTTSDGTESISQSMPLVIGNSDFMHPEFYTGDVENAPYRGELAEFIITRHPLSKNEIDSLYKYNKIPTLPYISNSVRGIQSLQNMDIRAWPNPFSEELFLEFENGVRNYVYLEVFDLNGRRVCSFKKSVIPNRTNRISWKGNLDNGLTAGRGMYLIMLRDTQGKVSGKKLVLKNIPN